ncbi:MAG: queuosine precursor transporter [Spartobacteria bacterium]
MIRRLTSRDTRLSSFRYYDLLVHIFVVILLISNLVGQKICIIPFIPLARVSGAQLLFPLTYIFADIFTEVYGYGAARRAIWIAFFANILLTVVGVFVTWFPSAPEFGNQSAFESVFYVVPRFVAASLIAFWAGEFTNSYTLAKMKLWTNGRWLWTRFVGSTITGQFVDTATVIFIAFVGWKSWSVIFSLMISGYLAKVIYEIALTPMTYLIVNKLKRAEGIDVFDRDTNFNPFARNRATRANEDVDLAR